MALASTLEKLKKKNAAQRRGSSTGAGTTNSSSSNNNGPPRLSAATSHELNEEYLKLQQEAFALLERHNGVHDVKKDVKSTPTLQTQSHQRRLGHESRRRVY